MKTKKKKGILRLIEIAGTKKWWLLGAMLLAVVAAICQFLPYIAVFNILIELANNARNVNLINKEFILNWAYISLASICLYGIIFYIANMLSHIAAFNILYELRVTLSKKLIRLPLGFFTKKSSGELKKIMSEDVERIELFVAHHIPDITTAVIFPLLTMGYLFILDWRLAIIIFIVFTLAVIMQVSMFISKKAKNDMKKYHSALADMNNSIVEYVRGIQVVKVFNSSIETFERLRNNIFAYRDNSISITKGFAGIYTGFLTLLSSTLLFITPVSILLLINAESYQAYFPTVIIFLILGSGIFFPMIKLMWMGGLLNQNSAGMEIIDEVLNKPEIDDSEHSKIPKNSSIKFNNVTFAYDETPVLNNISFNAEPGSVTALVGPSGAGKSTIGMLIPRFWDVNSGDILIGDVQLKDIPNNVLMNYVSFVFQDNMLFFDTIEENIRMGNKTASFEEVLEAAKAAHCDDFIQNLENGYKTLVGEGGTYLSGGEQQRIALARAILKNAPIVILDEATAFADPENEGKILNSFAKLIKNKTVIVIAHRLSTITNADQILVIKDGVIAEQGKHLELLNLNENYANMWNTYTSSRQWVIGNN